MKHTLFFIGLFLILGCSKNQGPTRVDNTAEQKVNPAQTINTANDTITADSAATQIQAERRKTLNSISCQLSKIGNVNAYAPSYYTVIGTFPSSDAIPSTQIPKGIWYSGDYNFNNQTDGNLVVYKTSTGKVLWASNKYTTAATHLQLQSDLNLVVYQGNTAIFESQTYYFKCGSQNPRNTRLILTNQGSLQIIADGFQNSTVVLGDTRTEGGVQSPNYGSFFKLYTANPGPGVYPFQY
ncbi:hypothetical protein IDJ77_13220 [Mucilaginibacter sp. ZT4R22]|uniref:Bulb-type lectin domain-containing protein n=1 Tax=Mucilaginibacter pankratovii TaxID=2772110 RepID=A0ABR7WR36_9SPHI|nr:hypothetical protein [Mucilaginibacter pankratovii]MBD1364775.1 hypothetical protein [Mucilaginibacter pankratovii]